MSRDEYMICPNCGSQLKSALVKCIYCKSPLKNDHSKDLSQIKSCNIAWLGGDYNGEVLEDKPHGYGVFASPKGIKYYGEWRDGKPHGKGKLLDKDGGVYEGDFEYGKKHGQGVYSHHDGRIYEGEWKEGKYYVKAVDKQGGFKKCPFCSEEIKAQAIKCKHCHSDLSKPPGAYFDEPKKENMAAPGMLFISLIFPIVGVIVGIYTVVKNKDGAGAIFGVTALGTIINLILFL